jgi:hypothetical protein
VVISFGGKGDLDLIPNVQGFPFSRLRRNGGGSQGDSNTKNGQLTEWFDGLHVGPKLCLVRVRCEVSVNVFDLSIAIGRTLV